MWNNYNCYGILAYVIVFGGIFQEPILPTKMMGLYGKNCGWCNVSGKVFLH